MKALALVAVLVATSVAALPIMLLGRRNGMATGSSVIDYTTSLYLTGPTAPEYCADAAITTDQAVAITVTRATSATCESAAGSIINLSNNRPAIEADGLRVEASSSNRVAYSEDISNNWTPTNAAEGAATITSPMGATINILETTSAGGYFQSDAFTITGTSAVASIFVKGTGTESYNVVLRDTTAGADRCTISGTAPAEWAEMKSRPSCNSASITTGNTHVLRAYPGGTAGSGSVYFWGGQVEPALTTKTSHIPTNGSAVTRNVDNITTTVAAANAAGCFSATFWSTIPAFPRTIASNPATLGNYQNTVSMLANDGTNTATSNNVSNMTDRSEVMRLTWSGSTMQIGLGASVGSAATFDGSMSGGTTTLYLGSLSGTSRHFGGWLKKIKFSTDANGCAL